MAAPIATSTSARQVIARTKEVRDYHQDDSTPGKPLFLMIPAGIVAVFALSAVGYLLYGVYAEENSFTGELRIEILLLLVVYSLGVFYFSYGYELYDTRKAIRLAFIIGIVGVAVAVIVVALLVLLGGRGKKAGSALASTADDWMPTSGFGSGSSSVSNGTGINVSPLVRPVINATGRRMGELAGNFHATLAGDKDRCSRCDQEFKNDQYVPYDSPLVAGEDFCPVCRQRYKQGGWSSNRADSAKA